MKSDKISGKIINVCEGKPLKIRYYTKKIN
jgi:hypothetical protein